MTKKQALEQFRKFYLPAIRKIEREYCTRNSVDRLLRVEEWNIYTDFLCKDDQITTNQYNNWSNPF